MSDFSSIGDILTSMKRGELENLYVEQELAKDSAHHSITGQTRRNFFKVFPALIDELVNLSGSEIKLFLYLAHTMSYSKSRLTMDTDFWDSLTETLQMSREYARRTLTSLKKKGFIYDDRFYLYVSSKYATKRSGK